MENSQGNVAPMDQGLSVCIGQQSMDVPNESPFSPEIQDIMYGGNASSGLPWLQEQSQVFRSHSVPVHFMVQGGSTSDQSPPMDGTIPQVHDFPQSFIDTGGDTRSNANQTMETMQQQQQRSQQQLNNHPQQRGLSCVGRGDHLISGAPFRPPLRFALNAELKARELYAQGPVRAGVPTPPSSQNTTPDFSHELPHYDVTAGPSSSNMDTPNSLEPMDPLLSSVCDEASQGMGRGFVWD